MQESTVGCHLGRRSSQERGQAGLGGMVTSTAPRSMAWGPRPAQPSTL